MTVVKVIEVVGSSPASFEEAVKQAVTECCRSVRQVKAVEVVNWTCNVENGKISAYKADCRIAFVVEGSESQV